MPLYYFDELFEPWRPRSQPDMLRHRFCGKYWWDSKMSPTVEKLIQKVDERIRPLLLELLQLPSFLRLSRISFLGAIERFSPRENSRTAQSRFEHSIGVAELALARGTAIGLTDGEIRLALVHALLHDIGHGPFSHSCEEFFRSKFGLDHHVYLISTIEDRTSDESKLLQKYGLWFDYRNFLRHPARIPSVEEIFFGPINVDTIEGIVRSSEFFGVNARVELDAVIKAMSSRPPRLRQLDSFWKLKHTVYNEHIFSEDQSRYDALICDALFSVADEVPIGDFRLDDEAFEERYQRAISHQLNLTRAKAPADRRSRERDFRINEFEKPKKAENLRGRYFEVKNDNPNKSQKSSRKH